MNRLEAGAFSQPPGGGGGVGRCVSARTRERSDQPLPLHPAIAIRLRRMANVLGGGGEWPWLAEHFAGGYLLAGYLLAGALPLRHWRMQTAPGYWRRRRFAAGNSPQANPPLLPRGVYKLRAE